MPTYLVAGSRLTTDLDLPELVPADGSSSGADDAPWRLVPARSPDPGPVEVVFEHLTPGRDVLWSRVSAGDGTYLLHFPNRVDFVVRVDERLVEMDVAADLPETTLRHLVVDQLVPHLLATGGDLVLHASAVALDSRAIAFLGASGAGKSSLAGGFVQRGAQLLADDYLLLRPDDGRYLATAAYPGLRLWGDSATHFAGNARDLPEVADYNDKRRWAVEPGPAGGETPLAAILVLGHRPGPDELTCQLGLLQGRDAFRLLYQQAFRVSRSGRGRQEAELDRFVDLADAVPVLLLEHRREYDALPEVIDEILAVLGRVLDAP